MKKRLSVALVVAAAAVVAFQAAPSANHSWNGYHWARTANPFNLDLGDNVSGQWDSYLSQASSDWSKSTVLNTFVVPGSVRPRTCKLASGRVEVCNDTYGFNGWLGVARISVSGTHITAGSVKVNDSYFNTARYNSPVWRQMVMCQEIGHTFGLNHQDENFDNGNLGTCMDYSSDPGAPPANIAPNQHDYDQLVQIYSHLDSFTTVGASTPAAAAQGDGLENPSEWGRLMQSSHGGRTQVFERDFGNGVKVVTFVIWA